MIEHFLQIVILPPRLGDVMIGENSSSVGDEKAGAEDIQVYFGTIPGKTHERIVVFVGRRFTGARHPSIAESQSRSVVAKSKHNMDEADAGFIGLDDSLSKLAIGLNLLEAAFYRR